MVRLGWGTLRLFDGIEIRKVTNVRDHEGGTVAQAMIYVDGKKTGFWSQDTWGGPDIYENCADIIAKRAKTYAEGYPKGLPYSDFQDDPDVFMGKVLDLVQDEKEYKKWQKKGCDTLIIVTDGYHYSTIAIPAKLSATDAIKLYGKDIEEAKQGMFKNVEAKVRAYSDVKDFSMIINQENPIPEWLID